MLFVLVLRNAAKSACGTATGEKSPSALQVQLSRAAASAIAGQQAAGELLQAGGGSQGPHMRSPREETTSLGRARGQWPHGQRVPLVRRLHRRCCAYRQRGLQTQGSGRSAKEPCSSGLDQDVTNAQPQLRPKFTPTLVSLDLIFFFFLQGIQTKVNRGGAYIFHCLSEMYLILLYIPFLGCVICLKKKKDKLKKKRKKQKKKEKIKDKNKKQMCSEKSSVTLD